MTEEVFRLQDGRKLCYELYGPPDGEPVLYFHGTPSSRLEPLILKNYNKNLEQLLNTYKIRLIATDRPGIGHSTYNPVGSFYSFAKDVNELADHMQINKCKLLCWSGGGPFALSLAYDFPNLVQQVYIVAGFTRSFKEPRVFRNMNGNIYYFWSAKNIPGIMRVIMNYIGKKEAHKPIPKWLSRLPTVDHDLLNDPAIIHHFSKVTLNEACRYGSRGLVHEAGVIALFWQSEWVYALPTPVPDNYKTVNRSEYIDLDGKLKLNNKPLFLHFFNPDCPCSRFNIKHFKSLVKEYGNKVSFAIIAMGPHGDYTASDIQDKFHLNIPVLFDSTIAASCGVYSTPQAAIITEDHRLYYRGNYNKSRYCTDKKSNYAQMALDSLLHQNINPVFDQFALKAYGCQLPQCTK